ncbi:hypothetical protein C5167_037727 [Papaver somniferum]|uniref:TF-B3 domain-containing protein n=1 Tax=Papaver somniferum TaxID=3469 RepID=A0A4Y7IBA5_PAPSO|nr:putative B3 domain-containing protein Os03g0621600 [Papaver somniferum]RZC44788.1 hypothetical protein C5167_037727 [Papaver somniferum]
MEITRNQKASTTPRRNQFNSHGNCVASADDDGTNEIGRRWPQFFQIMHNAIIQDGYLIIPPEFVAKHGDDLSQNATLKVPDGLTWDVKLKRDSNGFQIGRLVPFIEYYSISAGHLLLFKYHEDSQFQVIILDMSACEIEYPAVDDEDSSDDHSLEGGSTEIKSSDEEEEDYYVHASTDEDGDESSESPLSSSSEEEEEVRIAEKKNKKKRIHLRTKDEDSALRSTRLRAELIGDEFQSVNPFFTIALQPAYIKRKYLQIPVSFDEMHMFTRGKKIKAEGEDGRFWILGLPKKRRLTVGVSSLLKDNDLDVGDVIVVELMKEKKSDYLDAKVHIFRS